MKLNQSFNLEEFKNWVYEFLPSLNLDIRNVDIPQGFKNVCKILTLGESDIGVRVFVIEVAVEITTRKVGLAKDSFNLIKNYGVSNALIVYYSKNSPTWRISLLTSTPEWTEGKILLKVSNPKRHSYIVGEGVKVATPNKFLIRSGNVTNLKDLKSRFSLEVVNKDFYEEVVKSFLNLVGGTKKFGRNTIEFKRILRLPTNISNNQIYLEFAVRLLGRIIFCWFLREKKGNNGNSLVPVQLLSSNAPKNTKGYYHNILEPIFFEILNKPYRYRKEIYSNKPFTDIPYLNGGLFSPQEDDYYDYIESRQIENNKKTIIPDEWFINLFETLESYNFTLDENTSYDEELSIDPEMLGRIFENLLAEINPETGFSQRKGTGSYYTPREIVDYMIDESLLIYLKSSTEIDEEKIRSLISYDLADDLEFPLDSIEKNMIIESLIKIKILDPACGSGAFPIGILQKIVFILQQIDPNGERWFKKQLENASYELKNLLEKKFNEKNFDYIRKLGVIRENIYGVDIQPIATEISRLRCFLTLIVDERIDDNSENRGIEPLPNLDFKFVTCNSLINLPESSSNYSQDGLFEDSKSIEELRELRTNFFNSSGMDRNQLKLTFTQIQNRMLNKIIKDKSDGVAMLTTKLSLWDPFNHKMSDWFDPEWMFGIKDGFHIVIGNPPYNVKLSVSEKNFYKEKYKTVKNGRQDTAAIFVEAGKNYATKDNFLISYIIPYRLFSRKKNHKSFQNYVLNKLSINEVIYLGKYEGFENVNDEFMITFFSNHNINNKIKICNKPEQFVRSSLVFKEIEQEKFRTKEEININIFSFDGNLLRKIEQNSNRLSKICEVKDGIVPFIREKIISKQKLDSRYVPFAGIAGTYKLEKYFFKTEEMYICYDIEEAKKFIHNISELRKVQLREKEIFLQEEKILTSQNSKFLKGTIDYNKYFVSNSIHTTFLKQEEKDNYNLTFILACINSNLINYYHNSLRLKGTDLHPQILISNLKMLPIASIDSDINKEIAQQIDQKVKEIINLKNLENSENFENIKILDNEINQLIYRIYSINDDEINIVENYIKEL